MGKKSLILSCSGVRNFLCNKIMLGHLIWTDTNAFFVLVTKNSLCFNCVIVKMKMKQKNCKKIVFWKTWWCFNFNMRSSANLTKRKNSDNQLVLVWVKLKTEIFCCFVFSHFVKGNFLLIRHNYVSKDFLINFVLICQVNLFRFFDSSLMIQILLLPSFTSINN